VRHRAEAGVLGLLPSAGLMVVAPAAEARIVVGQSIAGVKLGMSMAQVKKKLGAPTLNQGADFKSDIEWNYAKKPLLAGVSHDFLAPRRVIRVVTEYYEGYVISASTAAGGMLGNPNRLVVEAHYYLRAGKCATYPSVRPQDYNDVQLIRDNMAGDYEVLCAKRNGKYITEFVPRRKFGYLPAAQHMNFAPVLAQVGNSGAESVGISAIQHGVPKRVEVNRKKHIAETDITYKKISPQPAGTRSLKELKYYMAKGKGRVQIVWYD
jgi:hypothetical protein